MLSQVIRSGLLGSYAEIDEGCALKVLFMGI
jgi:hypothetical protein